MQIEFHIKGHPLPGVDACDEINTLLTDSQLEGILRKRSNGCVISATAEESELTAFETKLLPFLATHFSLEAYTKKKLHPKTTSKMKSKREDPVIQAVSLLKKGKVIAVKTEWGYHIVANAVKIPAVKAVRSILGFEKKPLDIMFKSLISAKKLLLLSQKESTLLEELDGDFVITKIKTLHKLERTTFKYTLNRLLNPLNKRLSVSLPSGAFYKELYQHFIYPVVSVDALDSEGKIITTKEALIKQYDNRFTAIIDTDMEVTAPRKRARYQVVYGKTELFPPQSNPNADVLLDVDQTDIFGYSAKPLRVLLSPQGGQEPLYTAISMLFATIPAEDIAGLELPFDSDELTSLEERWGEGIETCESDSVLSYFDAITALCRISDEKEFETESLWHAENYFEVCEEEHFDYTIEKEGISIDLISEFCVNKKPKHLYSTLTNTISTIIVQIAEEQRKKDVTLSGALFGYRDLAELTIEKLEEAGIGARLV